LGEDHRGGSGIKTGRLFVPFLWSVGDTSPLKTSFDFKDFEFKDFDFDFKRPSCRHQLYY
jgi:hypothetical protein